MIADLNLVKKYIGHEEDYILEDDLLLLMIDNAEIYLEDAGVVIDKTNEKMMKKAKLIALILVHDFYENRELTGKVSEKRRDIVSNMIMQLKYCYQKSGDIIES